MCDTPDILLLVLVLLCMWHCFTMQHIGMKADEHELVCVSSPIAPPIGSTPHVCHAKE